MALYGNADYKELTRRLSERITQIQSLELDFRSQAPLDEYWYVQTLSEMVELRTQFEEAINRATELRKLMDHHYDKVRKRYRADSRWLMNRNRNRPKGDRFRP